MSKGNPDPKTGVDYEELGRVMEKTFVRDYVHYLGSTPRQVWAAFLRGLALGFGTVIGGTLIVALLLWLLGYFGAAPVIGEYIQKVSNAIQTGQPEPTPSPSTK